MSAAAQEQLDAVDALLLQARHEPAAVARLCHASRSAAALHAALPPRFAEVLLNLLDRLESSALFSEESCSFSQKDLLDNLQQWAAKARERLTGS